MADKQPQPQILPSFVGELLDQRQPSADPGLVVAEQFSHLDLGHAILTDQGMDDPGLFPLLGATAGLIEREDGGLGRALVGLEQPRADGLQSERPGGGQPLETVEDLVRLLAETDDQGRQLPIAPHRAGHGGLGVGVGEAIASITLAQLSPGQEADLTSMPVCHVWPRHNGPFAEKETGDRSARPTRSLLGLWGQETIVVREGHSKYVTT